MKQKYEPPTCVCGHLMITHGYSVCFGFCCGCHEKTLRTYRRHWLFRWRWVRVTNDPETAVGK